MTDHEWRKIWEAMVDRTNEQGLRFYVVHQRAALFIDLERQQPESPPEAILAQVLAHPVHLLPKVVFECDGMEKPDPPYFRDEYGREIK